ncbi:MAG: hypothetical protein F8N37_17485 [Telmatospirillum sp.]|nr:hypothetical protein [Telmatospirillum sp.]
MSDQIFEEFERSFAGHGRPITRIRSRSGVLFSVHPFHESFLGWEGEILAQYTVWESLPLVELSEKDILSGGGRLQNAIREAVDAMHVEEARISAVKARCSKKNGKKNQMEWW